MKGFRKIGDDSYPKLIDFEQSVPDGVPFFDLAYLEFDIIRRILPVEGQREREEWLALLDKSMSEIRVEKEITSWGAARAWQFLAPIREEVWRLRQIGGEAYELVWWLATAAVGLNFARKGDDTRSPFERMAGLLYAAYGLDRILKLFEVKDLPAKEQVPVVHWLHGVGNSGASVPSEPSVVQVPSTASLAQEMVQAVTEISQVESSAIQEPQFRLHMGDQPLLKEQIEDGSPSFSIGVAAPSPLPDKEDAPGKVESREEEADEPGQSLQVAVDLFQKGGHIFKDHCLITDQTLRRLEMFVLALSPKIPEYEISLLFPQQNLLGMLKAVREDLQRFYNGCSPAPTRNLTPADYDKECASLGEKLEKLQTKFQEFLASFP